jgi:hypothetical protein
VSCTSNAICTRLSTFTRADPGRGEGGTGLGVAIVQAIARSHGGEAHMVNGFERGVDVWIVIPATDRPTSGSPRSGTVQDRAGMLSARMSPLWSRRRLPRALLTLSVLVAPMLLAGPASAAVARLHHVFLIVGENTMGRARHDHYGLERTLAEGFGVAPLAHARHAAASATIWR